MNAKTHTSAKSLGHLDVCVIEEIYVKNKGIFIIKKENRKIRCFDMCSISGNTVPLRNMIFVLGSSVFAYFDI